MLVVVLVLAVAAVIGGARLWVRPNAILAFTGALLVTLGVQVALWAVGIRSEWLANAVMIPRSMVEVRASRRHRFHAALSALRRASSGVNPFDDPLSEPWARNEYLNYTHIVGRAEVLPVTDDQTGTRRARLVALGLEVDGKFWSPWLAESVRHLLEPVYDTFSEIRNDLLSKDGEVDLDPELLASFVGLGLGLRSVLESAAAQPPLPAPVSAGHAGR